MNSLVALAQALGIAYAAGFNLYATVAVVLLNTVLGFVLLNLLIAVGYFFGNWSVGKFMAHHDLHWMVVVGVLITVIGALSALAFVALGLTHPLWIFVPIGLLVILQTLGVSITAPPRSRTAITPALAR